MIKSTLLDRQHRGMASSGEIAALQGTSPKELTLLLSSDNACQRSAAAINLRANADKVCDKLLATFAWRKNCR